MPTYDYRCPFGHQFERFQKITDRARVRCPECGRIAQRMISGGAGLIFKGSGFYITDYGKDGKGPVKPETEAKAEPKAEAAPTGGKDPNPQEKVSEKAAKPGRKSNPGKAAP
jgi:putative FmdB family regulatory protein